MAQESIERIDISQTLPAITCDYESLKTWAQSITAKYQGLLVTEEQVKDIKKDMAEINKAKQKIERARIDAVKAVSAPIREFEAKIKEVCAIFDVAYDALGQQVKEIEATARERKREDILAMFQERIDAALVENPFMEGKFQVDFPANWLNKTFAMKAIKEEIDKSLHQQIDAQKALIRAEKAQEDRLHFIENAVIAACAKYGVQMPVALFMTPTLTSLDTDAEEVLRIIDNAAQRRKATSTPVDVRNPVETAPPKVDVERGMTLALEQASNQITLKLIATFTPEQEEQVREILNQNHFMRIVRQLKAVGIDVTFTKEGGE